MAGMASIGQGGMSGGDAGPSQASGSNVTLGGTTFGSYYAAGTGPSSNINTGLILAVVAVVGFLVWRGKK